MYLRNDDTTSLAQKKLPAHTAQDWDRKETVQVKRSSAIDRIVRATRDLRSLDRGGGGCTAQSFLFRSIVGSRIEVEPAATTAVDL